MILEGGQIPPPTPPIKTKVNLLGLLEHIGQDLLLAVQHDKVGLGQEDFLQPGVRIWFLVKFGSRALYIE